MTNAEISNIQSKIKDMDDQNFKLEKEISHLNDLASEKEFELTASLKKISQIEKGIDSTIEPYPII